LQACMCCCTAGHMDDIFEIRWTSASLYYVHDHAEFKIDTTTISAAPSGDVVVNVQLVDETCCSILDALQWLEC